MRSRHVFPITSDPVDSTQAGAGSERLLDLAPTFMPPHAHARSPSASETLAALDHEMDKVWRLRSIRASSLTVATLSSRRTLTTTRTEPQGRRVRPSRTTQTITTTSNIISKIKRRRKDFGHVSVPASSLRSTTTMSTMDMLGDLQQARPTRTSPKMTRNQNQISSQTRRSCSKPLQTLMVLVRSRALLTWLYRLAP